MPDTLAQKIKAKYPGDYDDIPDAELEAKIKAKYPGVYDDLPMTASRPSMNVATVNGQRVPVDDGPMEGAKAFGETVNPIPMMVELGDSIINAGAKAPYHAVTGAPGQAGQDLKAAAAPFLGLLKANGDLYFKGKDAAAKGNYVEAARHFVDWLIPVLGPTLDQAGDEMQQGRYWSGLGRTLGLGAQIAAPKALEAAKVRVPPTATNANALEADAMAFAEREGIPVDAGTATGNAFLRGTQALADRTPIGAAVAERARGQRAEALRATGGRLAGRVHADAVTPETAGEAVRSAVQQTRDTFGREADTAYGRLREIEGQTTAEVPVDQQPISHRGKMGMQREFGRELSTEELSELRRIKAELEAQRFQQGRIARGTRKAGDVDAEDTYVRGNGNAAVYHDIRQLAPGTADMSGVEMSSAIDKALTEGRWTNAARGAYEVAKARVEGKTYVRGTRLSSPSLPPGAGDVPPDLVEMRMPVDLRTPKKLLKPLYDRLSQQLPPAVRNSDEAYTALKNIMEYPDYAPLSDVDPALGKIKQMARSESGDVRDVSQGIAAQAVKALDAAVRKAAEQGGPDAVQALETGRAATTAKYGAQDVLKQIREEPVQAFQQAVYSKDAGIKQLRKVQELAPGEMPKLGRAFIEDVLKTATEKGGFDKGGMLFNKWASLGPETKQILFGDQTADLNRFFLLADRLAKVTNPSESALVGVGTGGTLTLLFNEPISGAGVIVGGGALSSILRNPSAVRLLTKGMEVSLRGGPARAARTASLGAVLQAARAAGVELQSAGLGSDQSERPLPETATPAAGR